MKQGLTGNIVREQNNGEGPRDLDGVSHVTSWSKSPAERGKTNCKLYRRKEYGQNWVSEGEGGGRIMPIAPLSLVSPLKM